VLKKCAGVYFAAGDEHFSNVVTVEMEVSPNQKQI
jgi:hypothetical protein